MDTQPQPRKEIRRRIRRLRDQLSQQDLFLSQRQLAIRASSYAPLRKAQRVLSYIPFGGEISPVTLQSSLHWAKIYQPRITSFERGLMKFYSADARKTCNRFGIWEPAPVGSPMPAQHFDVVLVPLVAFDRTGNRLGMGAGFYDRAMAFRLNNPAAKRPLLIGLAHHFQEVNSLSAQNWDVPLDVILTDRELIEIG